MMIDQSRQQSQLNSITKLYAEKIMLSLYMGLKAKPIN